MRHRRRRALPALMLALALAALAAPATAQAPPIDLREYWIIADIDNTKTGESESFRIDCCQTAALWLWCLGQTLGASACWG